MNVVNKITLHNNGLCPKHVSEVLQVLPQWQGLYRLIQAQPHNPAMGIVAIVEYYR